MFLHQKSPDGKSEDKLDENDSDELVKAASERTTLSSDSTEGCCR